MCSSSSLLVVVLVALAGAGALAAPVARAPPAFTSYIVATQFNCHEAGCGDWDLEVTRVDPTFRFKNFTISLATLLPTTPLSQIDFNSYASFHGASRTYYVGVSPSAGNGLLWGVKINNDVSAAEIRTNTKFQFPEAYGLLVGLHTMANSSVVLVFDGGQVVLADATTGALTVVGNLLSGSTYTDGHVTKATAYDNNTDSLFAIITNEYNGDWAVATLAVPTQTLTVKLLTSRQHERFGAEIFLEAVWNPDKQAMIVFLAAVSPLVGFDQVITVDPPTGAVDLLLFNLMENLFGFECLTPTKDCDGMQSAAFNPEDKHVYFQGSAYSDSDDDTYTTAVLVSDMDAKYPWVNAVIDPFSYGFATFQFVPVVSQ